MAQSGDASASQKSYEKEWEEYYAKYYPGFNWREAYAAQGPQGGSSSGVPGRPDQTGSSSTEANRSGGPSSDQGPAGWPQAGGMQPGQDGSHAGRPGAQFQPPPGGMYNVPGGVMSQYGYPQQPYGYPGPHGQAMGGPGMQSPGYGSSAASGQYAGGRRDEGAPSTTVWIGNVSAAVTEQELQHIFGGFGPLRDVKIVAQKSCAFIRYVNLEDARRAYHMMTNQYIGGQQIRVGWGKPETNPQGGDPGQESRNLWLGNIEPTVSEEELRQRFSAHGRVERVSLVNAKNCAFVTFARLEDALAARQALQGAIFGGRSIRINFGKSEPRDIESAPPSFLSSPLLAPSVSSSLGSLLGPEPVIEQPPAPTDSKLKDVIDKLAAHVVKAGPQLEETIRTKQAGNPQFAFLSEGGEFYDYYKWKIYDERQRNRTETVQSAPSQWPQSAQPSQGGPTGGYNAPPQQYRPPGGPAGGFGGGPPGFNARPQAPAPTKSSLSTILDTLVPTKDSIKRGKDFLMELTESASAAAAFISARVEQSPDFTTKLNMIYLTNDVLHYSLKNRHPSSTGDVFSDAFKPYLPVMLWSAHQNQPQENKEKVTKMLTIWKTKGIYNPPTIAQLESIAFGSSGPSGPPSGPPQHRAPGAGLGFDGQQQNRGGGNWNSAGQGPPQNLPGLDDLMSQSREDSRKRGRSPSPERRIERPRHY